ncbi:MAG: class I adenylate-forming enzyme family protein [Hyphomonadaceae bacterium]|nr:class I adenylate-forming enzyme family protein [Hyphomonadaceae bacterium]
MADTATFPVRTIAECNALLTGPGARFEMEEKVINGVKLRTYKNAPKTLRDCVLNSISWGEREFLVYQDERVTFGAHYKAVARLATQLRDDFGVRPGDRVAVIMRNYPQWSVGFYAALVIGAIATPMNSWWTGEELEYGLSDSGAKIAIVDPEKLERIREHMPKLTSLKTVLVGRRSDDEADPRIVSLDKLIGDPNSWNKLPDIRMPDAEVGADDDATIMYTSGTTGKPKGALATHRGIISNVFNGMACQSRHFLRQGLPVPVRDPKVDPPRIPLLAIPFFHATGAFSNLVPAIMNADKIVTMYKWDTAEALEIIQRERVTTIGGVPAIAWQVLEHPDRDKYDLSSIQFVAYGGAPSAPELVATIKRKFPSALASNGWGMTETCAASCVNFGKDYEVRPDSCGAAGPAMDFKIVGAKGETLGVNEVGELWVKGPNNCKAYWNKPEATAKTYIDGWVVTGDIGRIDEEGFVFLLDRAKDMLIRGGENIYCIEVESALYDHPAIMDAAVVGIPHKVLGEEVGAVVQVKPEMEVTADELRRFVSQKLATFKVPVEIQIQRDPLPRNANGKIMKNELRVRFSPRPG